MPSPDIFASIFGTGDFSEFDATSGTPTIVASPTHCGGYACKCDAVDDYVQVTVSEDEIYARFYLRYDTEPTAGQYRIIRNCHFLGDAGATSIMRCYMESRPAGKLFRLHARFPSVTDILYYYNWQINTWYCIEVYFKKHASTGRYKMWVNDALIADTGDINTSAAPTVDRVQFGICDYVNPSVWTNVYVACIAIADSGTIGTHNNSFSDGFESGDFSVWDAVVGTPSISADKFHCGIYSCEADVSPSGSEGVYVNLGHQKEAYLQFEVKFEDASPPASGRVYFAYVRESTDSNNILALFIYNDGGTVKWGYTYRSAGSTTTVNSAVSTDPDDDTWYCIKLKIVMSSRDGDAEGSYAMYVDDVLLDDIDQAAVDTDYTGVSVLRLITYTTVAGGATSYYDCITWQSTDVGACHAAGSVEPVTYEPEADCIPELTSESLQVFRNCQRINVENLSVDAGERGMGKLTLPYHLSACRGDLFHVYVDGIKLLQGKTVTVTKNRRQGTKTVECQTKTTRLYGRYVLSESHRTYSGQDAGAIVKDLIDYYFAGTFTSNNVQINIGVTVSDFDCYDKTVGAAIEELMRRCNAACYVDDDNDVHFFVQGTEASNAVFDRNNVIGDLVVDDVGEPVGTLIVKGVTGVSGFAGSGLPEVLHSDRRITSNAEAQEIAEALLSKYGETTTTKFSVTGFFRLKNGQSATLDMPLDGYSNETIIVAGVSWMLSPSGCRTSITVGELPVSYEHLLLQIAKDIQEQKVNRISNHTGTDTGDGDPVLEYNDILDTGLQAQVRVQTSDVELESAACATETDAANMALIILELELGGSGGSGYFILRLINTTTGDHYEDWLVYMDADLNNYHKRCLVLDDLSGDTIKISAEGFGTTDVYVRGAITVRQVLQHSHDVTQASAHEFD